MPDIAGGDSAVSAGAGVPFSGSAGCGVGTGRTAGAGGNALTGAGGEGGEGGGAGSRMVRGGSHGGIGDEHAARPIASRQAATVAALRPWPASLTRLTARSMRFLPGVSGEAHATSVLATPRIAYEMAGLYVRPSQLRTETASSRGNPAMAHPASPVQPPTLRPDAGPADRRSPGQARSARSRRVPGPAGQRAA